MTNKIVMIKSETEKEVIMMIRPKVEAKLETEEEQLLCGTPKLMLEKT
jgi:hypothetical protein